MKKKLKKRKLKIYKLSFYVRQWGMLERYTPLTINLVRYYVAQIRHLFFHKPIKAIIYIEDLAGFTKEQILPILADMPTNVKFIWGKRKKKVK